MAGHCRFTVTAHRRVRFATSQTPFADLSRRCSKAGEARHTILEILTMRLPSEILPTFIRNLYPGVPFLLFHTLTHIRQASHNVAVLI